MSNQKPADLTVLIISVTALIIPLIFMVSTIMEHTGGVFAYPLDDSYIHLAVAKNLTLNNIWGVTPHAFASASSSIIYPLLLAAIFKIIGIHTIVPFIINVIVGILFLVVAQRWIARQGIGATGQAVILLLAVFLIPLPVIVLVGMEHTLHLLFFFLFMTSFADVLETTLSSPGRQLVIPWRVYAYGALMMATRFESIALLVTACCILLYYKYWIASFRLGFICFLPVLIFGIISIAKGSYFLPNSVMVKPALPNLNLESIKFVIMDSYLPRFLTTNESFNTQGLQRLLLLIPLTYLVFRQATKDKVSYRYILLMLLVCTIIHITMTSGSFFARYEVYLIGSFVIVCGTMVAQYGQQLIDEKSATARYIIGFLGIMLLIPVVMRSLKIFDDAPRGAISTYGQQVQMGRFVHEYYNQESVAMNDIGAISYQSEGNNLDLWGLSDNIVARRRRSFTDSPDFLDSMSRQKSVKIALLYERRFQPLVQRWQKVASWNIPYKQAGMYDSISIFAVDPSEAPRLLTSLKSFQPSLPRGVIVKYY